MDKNTTRSVMITLFILLISIGIIRLMLIVQHDRLIRQQDIIQAYNYGYNQGANHIDNTLKQAICESTAAGHVAFYFDSKHAVTLRCKDNGKDLIIGPINSKDNMRAPQTL